MPIFLLPIVNDRLHFVNHSSEKIKRNRCSDALKYHSRVAYTVGASGVHISEHYFVTVGVGKE